ncbi:MAG: acetate--CoA ligase family protein [Syntrophales bacterium]|jgi:acetyltransferase|nr:acetate--CoA ligase family protein [Syntrophales bacterium]
MADNPLHLLMNPKSIAVAGASNNPEKMGTLQALSILKDGFPGQFYPVHPTEKTVLGHKAYPSASALPEAPDLLLLIVPTALVIPMLEDFAKLGTKRAIIISAGFKEVGPEGRALEERLQEIAKTYGLRFLGPNCMGIVNTALPLNLTIGKMDRRPGSLGMVSQSGTYVTQTLWYLHERGIRFSKAISCGNEANIDMVDALEYLGQDEQTKAIIMYIEGIRDGRRFIEAAQRITPHKPVLAQYVGGSASGARAGLSHTGSLAGPDFLYEGIFKQAGIIRCDSIEELYTHGWTHATQPPLRGRRLAVVTNSGGPGTAISHNADQGGMIVPRFSDGLQAKIRELIPPHGSSANPVDLTYHREMKVLTTVIPEMIMESGEIDGLVLHGAVGSGFIKMVYDHMKEMTGGMTEDEASRQMSHDMTEALALPWKHNLPMTVSSFFGRGDDNTSRYMDGDIPVFDSPEKAARGMASLLCRLRIRERKPIVKPVLPEVAAEGVRIIKTALAAGQRALDEHQSKRLLAAYGVPVTREQLADSEAEAIKAAEEIGFPLAIKACSPEIMHKSGKGLIELNIQTKEALLRAFCAVRTAAGGDIPILIQQMVAGSREFVAGMTRFPGFGPCVLFGLGGIFTEALQDTTFRAAPFGIIEAAEMLEDIKAKALLGEIRGMPAADAPALAAILQTVGNIAVLHPEIAEIDLNPLILAGADPLVADVLFVLAS